MSNKVESASARTARKEAVKFDPSESRLASIVVSGADGEDEVFEVDLVEMTDPAESTLEIMGRVEDGKAQALFDFVRVFGVDPSGWRMSKVAAFMEGVTEAMELPLER